MLVKLTILFENKDNLGLEISSLMQGILMEKVPREYGDYLHQSALKPYSQHVKCSDSKIVWTICTLNEEAKLNIIDNLSAEKRFYISYKDLYLDVLESTIEIMSYKELWDNTYWADCARRIKIYFNTPTAFKVDGRYQFYPTPSLILHSLASKYDAIDSKILVESDDFIDFVRNNVHIVGYMLKSTKFPLEGVTIPSFIGSITMSISGPQQFVNLVNMLCKFGEYSGVGIKSGIGMGALSVKQLYKRGSEN